MLDDRLPMADDLEVREGPRELTGVKQVGRVNVIAQGLQIGPLKVSRMSRPPGVSARASDANRSRCR